MKLYAISDIHLSYDKNRDAFAELPPHPDDWLILGGDIGETFEHLRFTLEVASDRFAKVIWVPGNHDLWTVPRKNPPPEENLQGQARYEALVALCHEYGALTPEDPFARWPGSDETILIAPLFNLYDYTFCPDDMVEDPRKAIEWAVESGVLCNDERFLKTAPFENIIHWCNERLPASERRLSAALEENPGASFVLINHFPLRQEHVRLWMIPRFSIWCGTRRTQAWHKQFPTRAVVYGHLHMRSTDYRDGVRFEEVSLGYPKHWRQSKTVDDYLREILPGKSGGLWEKLSATVQNYRG